MTGSQALDHGLLAPNPSQETRQRGPCWCRRPLHSWFWPYLGLQWLLITYCWAIQQSWPLPRDVGDAARRASDAVYLALVFLCCCVSMMLWVHVFLKQWRFIMRGCIDVLTWVSHALALLPLVQ